MQFLVVYIREAHALDSFLPKGGGEDPIVEDPRTATQRRNLAQTCVTTLDLDAITTVIDTIDDRVSRTYEAWPDRLYLVGRDGRIAYRGGPGPDGFAVDELDNAIVRELQLPGSLAQPESELISPQPESAPHRAASNDTTRSRRDAERAMARDRGASPDENGRWQLPFDFASSEDRNDLYRCGGQWLNAADADDYHSRILRWWKLRSPHFALYSTCDRRTAREALREMERTRAPLRRLFGIEPLLPPTVILLRSLVQYNAFAITEPDGARVPPEASGFSAFYHAFPCEQWLDVENGSDYPGAAGAYWDAHKDGGNSWGPLAVRHAAAQAFVEGIDPSVDAIRSLRAAPDEAFSARRFWLEKSIPRWLRYGAAAYCERFFVDAEAAAPESLRSWSLAELRKQGGVPDLQQVFACALRQDRVERSRHLVLQAGALVAFILDDGNPAVSRAHEDLRRAIQGDDDIPSALRNLEAAVASEADALETFIGTPR